LPNVFAYLNYRDFLRDYYQEAKAKNPAFSYQFLANKAGFKSKSFVKLVIDGRKNLSEESLGKLGRALRLPPKAFSYFEDLVAFNQAGSVKLRNFFFGKLAAYNSRNPARLILRGQYDFYSKWYHNTVRELVAWFPFGEDYELLARQIKPAVSARQARESVRLLLKLGLIRKTDKGYAQADPLVTTGDEVQSLAVENFHLQNLILAGESIDTVPGAQRDVSCLVLGLSRKGFEACKAEIQAMRKRLLKIAEQDREPERVYHAAFQFFPTSRDREQGS
jgi:uncharacterized protein (TIGR02147 family)